MLTISQLARFGDVSVKAVRHYHARGLLPEPERDASGYRRYDAAAVVQLVRIRTLARAGVPLSRVRELLAADDAAFAAAVAEIDRRLRAEIADRQAHRRRIAQLAAGDSLVLPPQTVAYLGRLRALGLPPRMIDAERDAWILVAAQLPEQMPAYMELKDKQLDDPAVLALYRELAAVIDWPADDPRLEALADRIVELLDTATAPPEPPQPISDELARLLDAAFVQAVPIARRLMLLVAQRGWAGWTKNQRVSRPTR